MQRAFPFIVAVLGTSLALSACEDGADILIIDEAASTVLVESNQDEGDGTLRAALEAASSDPAVISIQVAPGIGTVTVGRPLEFTGSQDLRIVGSGVVIDGSGCGCDMILATGGGDLELVNLTLRDGGSGVRVDVPTGRTGTVVVRLDRVSLQSHDGHGLLVQEVGTGSSAGLRVELIASEIDGNGSAQGATGVDGIRIVERGEGNLELVGLQSLVTDNAGDGVALSEEGGGDLLMDVQGSSFGGNGDHPQSPSSPLGGLRATEAGSGSLDARILSSDADGNADQGVELTESGPGDLRVGATGLRASGNRGDNLRLREDVDAAGGATPGAGGLTATFVQLTTEDADDDGTVIEELGAGDLSVEIQDGALGQNGDDGLVVTQMGTGTGRLHLVRVATDGNGGLPVTTTGTAVTEGNDVTAVVRVRNGEDDGFGSLRAALAAATADAGVSKVLFEAGIGGIEIDSSLEYGGDQDLEIQGAGAWVTGQDCSCVPLRVTGSGDLVLEALGIRDATENGIVLTGGGNLTLRNLAVRDNSGHGVFIDVPDAATGVFTLILEDVSILGNELHGLFVDDLLDAGGGGTGGSSAAGVFLELRQTLVQGNGFRQGVTDRDGIRVDEGGGGGIELRMTGSVISGNAADGIDLNEDGIGDVVVEATLTKIDQNGSQPQNPDQLEDGIDITEAGPGAVRFLSRGSGSQLGSVNGNAQQGIEIVEEGSGDVTMTLEGLTITGNGTSALDIIEDRDASSATAGSGGIVASFLRVTAGQSSRDGLRMQERGVGDLTLTADSLRSTVNGGDGAWIEEQGIGNLLVDLRRSSFSSNGQDPLDPDDLGDGMEIRESGAGTVDLRFLSTVLSANGDQGLDLEEEGSGDLRATFTDLTASGNAAEHLRLVEDAEVAGPTGGSGSLYLAITEMFATGTPRDGVFLAENGDGNLFGQILASTIRNSGDNGVDASQGGSGTGQLQLVGVTLAGNGGGNIASDGVTVSEVAG